MFALAPSPITTPFARAIAEGLTLEQKSISASWLYDELGSALFEAITVLPEYGLTRADSALLESASREIVSSAHAPGLIIELGSGTGTKTRHILEAAAAQSLVEYIPIDISRTALEACALSLKSIRGVSIRPVEATYLEGIECALADRPTGRRALILFLGSTIGNFAMPEAERFLHSIGQRMRIGDSLLLGADLVKDRKRLLAAYDDALGVTAAFNLNLLARINRELDGGFRIRRFAHEARYNERGSRIEMHLRSRISQTVRICALDLDVHFRKGETIWTESSHKFEPERIRRMGENAGWHPVRQWLDNDWGFAETLFAANP